LIADKKVHHAQRLCGCPQTAGALRSAVAGNQATPVYVQGPPWSDMSTVRNWRRQQIIADIGDPVVDESVRYQCSQFIGHAIIHDPDLDWTGDNFVMPPRTPFYRKTATSTASSFLKIFAFFS